MKDTDPVVVEIKEWAKQEKELIDKFVETFISFYGEDTELHPGQIDDMFRMWHDDEEGGKPEDT